MLFEMEKVNQCLLPWKFGIGGCWCVPSVGDGVYLKIKVYKYISNILEDASILLAVRKVVRETTDELMGQVFLCAQFSAPHRHRLPLIMSSILHMQ